MRDEGWLGEGELRAERLRGRIGANPEMLQEELNFSAQALEKGEN